MSLQVIISIIDKNKEQESLRLKEFLSDLFESNSEYGEAKLYLGYPIIRGTEDIKVDAILISRKYGIVIFSVVSGDPTEATIISEEFLQKKVYTAIYSKLISTEGLADIQIGLSPALKAKISVVTFAPMANKSSFFRESTGFIKKITSTFSGNSSNESKVSYSVGIDYVSLVSRLDSIKNSELLSIDIYERIVSSIQNLIGLKITRNRPNAKDGNKGGLLDRIERAIATLDSKQEETILRFFDGIQRIRGLAGSGKTIILAQKIALFHANRPNERIAVTFNTRSQKQQFEKYINTFCIGYGKDPDWSKIKILQAWGSPSSEGIYYNFCIRNGLQYLDFQTARTDSYKSGSDPFAFVCERALNEVEERKISPQNDYDIVFIDEAQDLNTHFLKLCFSSIELSRDGNKKLVYAYDELQKLDQGYSLPDPVEIFGEAGKLDMNADSILYKCYRNSKQVITTAHALGFGIYYKSLIQFFHGTNLWKDIGYTTESNQEFTPGQRTVLYRSNETSPKYFLDNSFQEEFIEFKGFDNKSQQIQWIVDSIEHDIKVEGLLPSDIMVINPIAITTKSEVGAIRIGLVEKGINSHIAGESDADIFFRENSVTLTGINRAKGNEVGMVYIINADNCYEGQINGAFNLKQLRNILFTSITRSKAWVRVVGVGNNMKSLISEFEELKQHDFKLSFIYPTPEEMDKMNITYRTINQDEADAFASRADKLGSLNDLLDIVVAIKNGKDSIENYPIDIREKLKQLV